MYCVACAAPLGESGYAQDSVASWHQGAPWGACCWSSAFWTQVRKFSCGVRVRVCRSHRELPLRVRCTCLHAVVSECAPPRTPVLTDLGTVKGSGIGALHEGSSIQSTHCLCFFPPDGLFWEANCGWPRLLRKAGRRPEAATSILLV